MRRDRYPLESLAQQRARKVQGAVQGLARAVAQRERAGEHRRQSEQRRDTHEAQAARVSDAERRSLERGELSVADLAHAHAWQLRAEAERAALAAEVARARTVEADAVKGEDTARGQVAERRADADVVEKDRARWTTQKRKREDAKEEEAMAEAFRRKP